MSINSNTVISTPQDAVFASPLAELNAREAIIKGSFQALEDSHHEAVAGQELLLIQSKKLYRAAGFKSFDAYLRTCRNPLSRARAYQLIDFAKARELAKLEGTAVPVRERQSRATKSKGHQSDAFAEYWVPIFKYIEKKFGNCPRLELTRFAECLDITTRSIIRRVQRLQEKPGSPALHPIDQDPYNQGKVPTQSKESASPIQPDPEVVHSPADPVSTACGHSQEPDGSAKADASNQRASSPTIDVSPSQVSQVSQPNPQAGGRQQC